MEAKKIKQEAARSNAASVDTGQDEKNEFARTENQRKTTEDGAGATAKPANNGAVIPVRSRSAVAAKRSLPSAQPESEAPPTDPMKNLPTSNACAQCGRVCNSSEGLEKHIAINHTPPRLATTLIAESASFPCEVCNLVFDDAQSAANHSAAVHIADPRKRLVVCDLCLRVFANSFQMRVHRRVYHIPMRCKSCRTFYTRSAERMSRHEAKCETAASAAAKRRNLQAAPDVSVQKGRAMPADEDYGETVQELETKAAEDKDGGPDNSIFRCADCSFSHPSFAAVFSHTASAHALRFSAVTSDLRVSVRKADVEAATAALARDIAESSRQRRFMCRVCNFEDAAMSALKAHLKTHTDEEKIAAKKKIRQQAQQASALRIKTEAVEPPVEAAETANGQQVQERVPEERAVSPPPPPPPNNNAGKKLIQVSAAKPRVEEQPKKADTTATENKPDEPEIVFRCSKCSFKASNVVDIKNHKMEAHPKKDKKAKKKGGTEKRAVKTIKFAARKKVANAKGIKEIKKEAVASEEVSAPAPAPPPPPPILKPPNQQRDPAAAAAVAANGLKEPTLYRCKICLFRAPTANDVKIHLREAHPNRKSLLRTMNNLNNQKSGGPTAAPVKNEPGAVAAKKVMKCARCEFSTTALPAMRQHVLNVHPTQERQDATKCHVCAHQSATAVALQHHAKSHRDPATGVYACRHCTFSSSYFKPLNKHAETYVHENEDPLGTSGDPLAMATSEEADPLALNSGPTAAKRIKIQ